VGHDPGGARIGRVCDRRYSLPSGTGFACRGMGACRKQRIGRPADIMVLTIDSDGAGALEAADLVQSGVSKRVAVFKEPPTAETTEFVRRGLPYEDAGTRQIRQLTTLGVTDVVQISRVNGTGDEGQVLPQWTDEQHLRSIVVVATKDHSRRLRRVLDRAMKGHPTHFTVQAARYSSFDPDRWWETRKGVRTEIVELQKLLLDFVLHPLSFLTSSLSMQRQKGLPVSGGADPWPPPPDQESHHLWRLDAGQSGVPLNEPCWSGRHPNKAPDWKDARTSGGWESAAIALQRSGVRSR
jgi:hypothetical protein